VVLVKKSVPAPPRLHDWWLNFFLIAHPPLLGCSLVYFPTMAFMRTLLAGLLLSTILLAQSQSSISVAGNVPRPLNLTLEDLAKMPRAKVGTYDGVWLHEILTKAGFEAGSDRPGYVVAFASDGYRAVFSLAEADPTVTETQILIADKANGQALTGRDGAFRLVVPKDIRGLRSVRQLTRIEVVLLR